MGDVEIIGDWPVQIHLRMSESGSSQIADPPRLTAHFDGRPELLWLWLNGREGIPLGNVLVASLELCFCYVTEPTLVDADPNAQLCPSRVRWQSRGAYSRE